MVENLNRKSLLTKTKNNSLSIVYSYKLKKKYFPLIDEIKLSLFYNVKRQLNVEYV